MMFEKSQIEFMKNNEFEIDFEKELSDDDYISIEERASYLLQTKGFDKDYKPTLIGEMCEKIIDNIA